MVDLGQLISNKVRDKAYFHVIKFHWGDVARELLDIDSNMLSDVSIEQWEIWINTVFTEELIKSTTRVVKRSILKSLLNSEAYKIKDIVIKAVVTDE
jgi:hypothetical protein